MTILGHNIIGSGKEKVIIIHDWFSDITSYDPMLPYLNKDMFTYAFMDIRGYGKSKGIEGKHSADEIVKDIQSLANHLKWDKFHLIGHSMAGMAVQLAAYQLKERIKSVVAITPVPACGLPADDNTLAFMTAAASDNEEYARQVVNMMSGSRLTKTFVDSKVKHWHACSIATARVDYLLMYVKTDFSAQVKGINTPILIIAGEYDAESFNESVMRNTCMQWYPNAELILSKNSAHYPMQETPIFLATAIENFMSKHI